MDHPSVIIVDGLNLIEPLGRAPEAVADVVYLVGVERGAAAPAGSAVGRIHIDRIEALRAHLALPRITLPVLPVPGQYDEHTGMAAARALDAALLDSRLQVMEKSAHPATFEIQACQRLAPHLPKLPARAGEHHQEPGAGPSLRVITSPAGPPFSGSEFSGDHSRQERSHEVSVRPLGHPPDSFATLA